MQELEKILEEIDKATDEYGMVDYINDEPVISKSQAKNIIRKHMNDGWIPVDERLPEVNRSPEEDDECPEFNVTIRGAEKATTLKYSPADHTWFDDNGYVYDVIAWRPMPDVYRPADKTERSE